MIGRALTCLALAGSSAPAAAAPLQPTGKWTVDFANHECLLARPYARRDEALILGFRKLPMSAGIEVITIRPSRKLRGVKSQARISFAETPASLDYYAFRVGEKQRTITVDVKDDSYKAAVQSGVIGLDVPDEITADFAVPQLGAALKILDQCTLNLGEVWGIPKAQQLKLSRPAKMRDGTVLFSSDDYPQAALKNDVVGMTVVRLMIDESGRASDCVIVMSSKDKALDTASCAKLLKRADYEPALDLQGKPMRSLAIMKIRWMIMN